MVFRNFQKFGGFRFWKIFQKLAPKKLLNSGNLRFLEDFQIDEIFENRFLFQNGGFFRRKLPDFDTNAKQLKKLN